MKYIKSIFAVSIVAMAVVGNARADIASTTYVDNKVSPVSTKADNNAGEIATLKSGKQDKSAMVGSDSDKLDNPDNNTNYPTVAAVYTITTNALGNQVNNKLDKTFTGEADKSKAVITNDKGAITTGTISSAMITDGAVTSDKIANGTIAEEDLSKAVKDKLNAAVQTFNPESATAGKYVTNFTKSGTTVTATTAYVQIPVGSATAPTSVASIWVE